MKYDGRWWKMMKCYERWWKMMQYYEIWWNTMKDDKKWSKMMKYYERWWKMIKDDEILWKMMKDDEILWKMMNYYEIRIRFCQFGRVGVQVLLGSTSWFVPWARRVAGSPGSPGSLSAIKMQTFDTWVLLQENHRIVESCRYFADVFHIAN